VTTHTKRIGLLVPAANTTVEAEAAAIAAGAAWTAHYQRLPAVLGPEHGVDEVLDGAVSAAALLVAVRPDVIGLAYTAGSYLHPDAFDDVLPKRLEEATGRPAVTAGAAIVKRLRATGVERVAVVSPYAKPINDACESYLAAHGFEVVAVVGEPPSCPAGEVPVERIADLVREAATAEPEGVLISCTALRTLAALDRLSEMAGLPVTSSNDALIRATAGTAA
jgi:maleate cis-trans isomerase